MEALTHSSFNLCYLSLKPPFSSFSFSKKDNSNRISINTPNAATNSGASTSLSGSKWADRLLSDFQFLPTSNSDASTSPSSSTFTSIPPSLSPPDRHISIPLNFYQVLGAEAHFLGDGIRRAYEGRVSKPPQYGFTQDALIARRQILQAACDTLSDPDSRRDYNLGLSDAYEETTLFEVPFDKVPGALCVLQEAGESELVLRIGDALLKERLSKPFKHDIVLAMSLAFIDLSRDAMSLSPPDYIYGCEALERALRLLQSGTVPGGRDDAGKFRLADEVQETDPLDAFLEEVDGRFPPLMRLKMAVQCNIIHSFKAYYVDELYEKWRTGTCEFCDESIGENGLSGHNCKESGYSIIFFNEGSEDELIGLVKQKVFAIEKEDKDKEDKVEHEAVAEDSSAQKEANSTCPEIVTLEVCAKIGIQVSHLEGEDEEKDEEANSEAIKFEVVDADDSTLIEAHRSSDTTIEVQISDLEIEDGLVNCVIPLKTTTMRGFENDERKKKLNSLHGEWPENPPESGHTNEGHNQQGRQLLKQRSKKKMRNRRTRMKLPGGWPRFWWWHFKMKFRGQKKNRVGVVGTGSGGGPGGGGGGADEVRNGGGGVAAGNVEYGGCSGAEDGGGRSSMDFVHVMEMIAELGANASRMFVRIEVAKFLVESYWKRLDSGVRGRRVINSLNANFADVTYLIFSPTSILTCDLVQNGCPHILPSTISLGILMILGVLARLTFFPP